jgi:hypothetical protein
MLTGLERRAASSRAKKYQEWNLLMPDYGTADCTLRCKVSEIADRRIWFLTRHGQLTYIPVGMVVRPPKHRKKRSRDPERTRVRLLQAAFREVYRSGFQSASLDTILAAGSPRAHCTTTSKARKPWDMPSSKRSLPPTSMARGCVRCKGPCRRFDRHCSGYIRSAQGCAGRLSPEQSGAGNVSS